jgi:FkbM family methyltransferase
MLKSLVKQAIGRLGYRLVPIETSATPTICSVPGPDASTPLPSMSSPDAFLPAVPTINVVDVGAMFAGDGSEPYSALRNAGLARVVGFEPVAEECERLNRRFGLPHRYLQYAIGDGTARRLHVCTESMTSSLYEPNTALLSAFDGLEAVVRVVRELPIETHRLDDVPEAAEADYLKIDAQGAALDVLRGAPRLLARALVVHTEVEFAPLYRDQPLFADVDTSLRGSGYGLFTLDEIHSRVYLPLGERDVPSSRRFRQALWTDAVYVRHLFELDRLDARELAKLFVILHVSYGAIDLCARVLEHLDAKSGTAAVKRYRSEAVEVSRASTSGRLRQAAT